MNCHCDACDNPSKKVKREAQLPFLFGAGDEARTRDLNLGKVALYQLSYSRKTGTAPTHTGTTPVLCCIRFRSKTASDNDLKLERETRLELATSTLARLRSTN